MSEILTFPASSSAHVSRLHDRLEAVIYEEVEHSTFSVAEIVGTLFALAHKIQHDQEDET